MKSTLQNPGTVGPAEAVPTTNSVRGFACLLVVALHVIGIDSATGLHLPMTSGWHYAMTSIEFLRMPLFTALSGYLYAGNRVTKPMFKRFWLGKLRRIALPLVCLTGIVWALRRAVYHSTMPISEALLFGYEHLWYLQALLIIFAVMSVWDVFCRPSVSALFLVGFSAIMVAQSTSITPIFSLGGAVYLAPYFLFGIVLRERNELLRDRKLGLLAFGLMSIVLTTQQFGLNGLGNGVTVMQLPAALAGMASVFFLLQRVPPSAALASVGRYSYTIYLWHVLGAAAARNASITSGITNTVVLFIIIFAAAIFSPIVLYYIARRIPLVSECFTGERFIHRRETLRRSVPADRVRPDDLQVTPVSAGHWMSEQHYLRSRQLNFL